MKYKVILDVDGLRYYAKKRFLFFFWVEVVEYEWKEDALYFLDDAPPQMRVEIPMRFERLIDLHAYMNKRFAKSPKEKTIGIYTTKSH